MLRNYWCYYRGIVPVLFTWDGTSLSFWQIAHFRIELHTILNNSKVPIVAKDYDDETGYRGTLIAIEQTISFSLSFQEMSFEVIACRNSSDALKILSEKYHELAV